MKCQSPWPLSLIKDSDQPFRHELISSPTLSPQLKKSTASFRSSRFGDELVAGDVIHAVNGKNVKDIHCLKDTLESLSSDSPVVLQVERSGTLQFVVAHLGEI